MPKGLFVTVEGGEGCGKSTQVKRLEARLEKAGLEVFTTREPGGTPLGESVRHLLKYAPEGRGMTSEAELLLFVASRAELVRKEILPRLNEGTHILADRFFDSTVVYQGLARGLDESAVRQINDFAVGSCRPDLTLILDMDSGKALERARKQTAEEEAPDRMEQEEVAFYETIRQGFLQLAELEPERIVVLNADMDPDAVESAIWDILTTRFHGVFS